MTDDDLESLLTPKPATSNAAMRNRVYAASLAGLPRRTNLWKPLAVAAVFACGIAAGWFAKSTPEPVIVERVISLPLPAPIVPPAPIAEPLESKSLYRLTAADLDKLETAAELAEPATAARLYRRVADAYLARSDVIAATRCYRLHLNELGREGLKKADDDSWLLVSMKTSTRMEMNP